MAWCCVMPSRRAKPPATGAPAAPIERAFDALRFGAARTLNLRDGLPSVAQAVTRVDQWLRLQQAQGGGEVLVITGRGLGSLDGVGKVREGVRQRCVQLKRLNVVTAVRDHGPGAVIVTVAPLRAMLQAPRLRTGRKAPTAPADPAELAALPEDVRGILRDLALCHVEHLGVRAPSEAMVASEMLSQFGALTPMIMDTPDRVAALRQIAEDLLRTLREE